MPRLAGRRGTLAGYGLLSREAYDAGDEDEAHEQGHHNAVVQIVRYFPASAVVFFDSGLCFVAVLRRSGSAPGRGGRLRSPRHADEMCFANRSAHGLVIVTVVRTLAVESVQAYACVDQAWQQDGGQEAGKGKELVHRCFLLGGSSGLRLRVAVDRTKGDGYLGRR